MKAGKRWAGKLFNDLGVSIIVIAVGMVFILGMAGLGVDLASLYVARSQAQRAADAAALAGAQYWATNGCASGINGNISSGCQTMAIERAEAVGDKNLIAGVSPSIQDTDITFPSLSTSDPQIHVVAARNTAHGNPMPTFFVKIFGIDTANVSASATAEAYNATGQAAPIGSKCVKPWLLPDCDPNTLQSTPNPYCQDSKGNTDAGSYFTSTGVDQSIIGQTITLKPGSPSSASGPSEFYPVYVQPASNSVSSCPSCASNQVSSGSNSGDLYRQNIECCMTQPLVCGSMTIESINGNMVGPTSQGVECLIHEGTGNTGGQDTYDPSTGVITAGSSNPYGLTGAISTSDSIVTVPIYDGQVLCPGGSTSSNGTCNTSLSVQVEGFMQLFIKDVGAPQGTVTAYVMALVSCSGGVSGSGDNGGGGSPQPVIGSSSVAIPVRLIQ